MIHLAYNSLDSTNTTAKRLAALNPNRAMLISAATQTAGRGRLGHVWQSPAGGAWFTLAYPVALDPIVLQAAPLAVAAAVVNVLKEACGGVAGLDENALTIKWPNDILLNNRKLCGILCETTLASQSQPASSQANKPKSTLILGVGLNVHVDPCELAAGEMRFPATSLLAETGMRFDIHSLVNAIGRRMNASMDELCEQGLRCGLIKTVKRHLAWRGALVTLQRGHETLEGVIMGIDGMGRLMLATGETVEVINSGEVTTVREVQTCGAAG